MNLLKIKWGIPVLLAEGRKGNPELQTSSFPSHIDTFKMGQLILERV